MSKSTKNYSWLNTKPNSAKTLIEKAKSEAPGFRQHVAKFEEQVKGSSRINAPATSRGRMG
ncbi:MAG: hypothetical protein K9I94_08400 [Bacteroidales bacterium]|nr:hypothetical protein [Bacteroidales bacterium]